MTRSSARWLFSAFWGLLATSALSQALQNASQGHWKAVFWGSLVTLWTGANSYLWATGPSRRGPQEEKH